LEASIKVAKEGEKRAVGERDIGAGAKVEDRGLGREMTGVHTRMRMGDWGVGEKGFRTILEN
jgi:hypothetical protein